MRTPILRTLLAALACTSLAAGAELKTLSGKTLKGEPVSISEKEIVFREGSEQITVPIDDVLQLDLQPAQPLPGSARYTLVELTDGSQLQCRQFVLKRKEVELTLVTPDAAGKGPVVRVPLDTVGYVLHDAHDKNLRQEWDSNFLAKRGNRDVLAVRRDDGLNRLEGTLGEGDAEGKTIEFQLAGGDTKAQVGLTRIQGMVFFRKPDALTAPTLCRVSDLYGNKLTATKVEVSAKGYAVTTVAGAKLNYPKGLVVRLDYSKGKLAFLSDLEPVNKEQLKPLEGFLPLLLNDRNFNDGPLSLGGQTYPRGVALRATARPVYELDGGFKEFKFVLGADDTADPGNAVKVRIDGDGRELFAGVVARKEKPRTLTLNVAGVRKLRIDVSADGVIPYGKEVCLGNAQLSK